MPECEFNVQCLCGSLWLQPEAIIHILSEILRLKLYPGSLSLIYLYVQDTQEDNNGLHVPAILLLLIIL